MKLAYGIRMVTTLLLLTLCLAPQASAHSAPEKARSFYSGIAHTTEAFNLELLVDEHKLQLFVRDRHNWPMDIRGFGATAQVWGRDGSAKIELSPGERSALVGEGDITAAGLERVIVTLRAPGRQPITAWFTGARAAGQP